MEELGLESGPGTSPWLFKAGQSVDSVDAQHENWCGVLQEVALEGTGGDPAAFLRAAVEFANERAWGTLSAGLIIHPATKARRGLQGRGDGGVVTGWCLCHAAAGGQARLNPHTHPHPLPLPGRPQRGL